MTLAGEAVIICSMKIVNCTVFSIFFPNSLFVVPLAVQINSSFVIMLDNKENVQQSNERKQRIPKTRYNHQRLLFRLDIVLQRQASCHYQKSQ